MPPELAYGGINRSLARESVAGDLPDSVRLEVKKSSLRPFYHQTLSGPDLAAIRLLLQRSDARIYEYVDRDWMLEAMQRPTPIGQAGWKFWVLAMWLGLTGEIAIRSLEDAGFCQDFIDAHEPPAGRYTEL